MSKFNDVYKRLNEAQKEAVDSIYGPIMVVAGPWTWKTQIIWARTANIILKGWVSPENILITTFTEVWVVAIKNRLLSFIWKDSYKVNVSTIHSFAQDVISTFPEKFIEYKAKNAIDEVEQIEIFREIFDKLIASKELEELKSISDKYYYLRTTISKISTLKNEWVSFTIFDNSIEDQVRVYDEELSEIKPNLKKYETTKSKHEKHIKKLKELSLIYREYQKMLRERELYDFNDMINFVLEAFNEDEDLRFYYAEKYQFIMLDEYQDTNNAQNQIINLILSETEDKPNIMVVGDDDQSIYRFQGANIENMLNFSLEYPDTKYIVLEQNYRSNQQILDLSSSLIENNNERLSSRLSFINKKLTAWSASIKAKNPEFTLVKSDILEMDFVLNKIKELQASGHPLEEIAIIVRWNHEVKAWSDFLASNEIPVESKMKSNILESEYAKLILDYLSVISNPNGNDEKIIRILSSNLTGNESVDVYRLNKYLYEKNYKLKHKLKYFDVLTNNYFWDEIELENKESLLNFKDLVLTLISEKETLNLSLFLNKFFEKTKILNYVKKVWNFDDIQDVYSLFNLAKRLNENNKSLTLADFLNKIALYRENSVIIPRQILKTENLWVNIMTAHASKGLEYNTVFLPSMYEWNWSWKKKRELLKLPLNLAWNWILWKEHDVAEEDRRLFFVAITRAKENLFISMPQWVNKSLKVQSVFLTEIDELLEKNTYENADIEEDILNVMIPKTLEIGDKELQYIEEFLKDYRISPSDLNVFLENPLEFLNRTVFRYPFTDNIHTIFWSVYHKVLENLFLWFKNNQKFASKEEMLNDFKNILSRQIITPEEEEDLMKMWIDWLSGYYDIAISSWREIVALEYDFRPRKVSFRDIPLTWKIDKIEKDASWNLVLVDYKTGSKKSVNFIKWLTNTSEDKPYFRQLLFYRLMLTLDPNFSSNTNPVLAIDFCAGKKWEYSYLEIPYDDEELLEFENELIEAWEKIKDINYWREVLSK